MNKPLWIAALSSMICLSTARAGDDTVPGEVYLTPSTLECLAFEWEIAGDDNRNARVDVQFRRKGDETWQAGPPLFRMNGEIADQDREPYTAPNLFAGSLFDLQPGTEYEVRLSLSDPDSASEQKTVVASTRPIPQASDSGRTLHVYSPEHTGQKQQPSFQNVADAYSAAEPGDIILIHAGTFQQDLSLNKQAAADRPIVLRGAGDGPAILRGQGNVLLDMSGSSHHILEDLVFEDADTLISGGSGDRAVTDLTIRRCTLRDAGRYGVRAIAPASRNLLICDSTFEGPATDGSWHPRAKNRGGLPTAVWLSGSGHVVSYNRIAGFWDGISVTGAPQQDRSLQNRCMDFHNNLVSEMMDDGIEGDYGMRNIRIYRNFIYNTFMGISSQPSYGGPTYIFRNVVYNRTRSPLKLSNFTNGLLIYNNTCFGRFKPSRTWQNADIRNNLFLPHQDDRAIATGNLNAETTILDYNGYRLAGANSDTPIWWRFVDTTKVVNGKEIKEQAVSTLEEFAELTGYEVHGVVLDYDIFRKVTPEAKQHAPLPDLDLRLVDGSAAVDAGAEIPWFTDGFSGKAPDLGAYEVGQELPHYGPRLEGAGAGKASQSAARP